MYEKNSLLLAFLLTSQAFAVSVDFYDEQQNNPSITGIKLRINNDSSSPIRDAKLRYYFHQPSSAYAVDEHYLAGASISVNDVNEDLAYFELGMPSISVGYYPNMDGFSISLHNENWSSWDKSKDYSYQAFSSFKKNTKVVLLSGDDVVFGTVPDVQIAPEPKTVKISGLKFSENSWLELKNDGKSTVVLSNFQLVDANNSAFSINGSLESGEVLRICQNQTACGNAGKSQILSNFNWGGYGEAFLKQNNSVVSYVAWGEPGAHAADAFNAGVWADTLLFFPAESRVQDFNADYTKDAFFRLKPNKSGVKTDDWFSFTSNDNPAEVVSVPLPIKTSANKPVIKQIPGDNSVLFSWLPVQGVDSYRVVVRDRNNNDIYNLSTPNTSLSLELTEGLYSWTVVGCDVFGGCAKSVETENFLIRVSDIDTSIFNQLKIHEIAARRDTKMLNPGYGYESYKFSWDRPNLDATIYEPKEDSRCWAIAIQVMNHFYGGNLTQDEIVYKAKFVEGDPLLSPFFDEGNAFDDLNPATLSYPRGNLGETLKWALHTDVLNYSKGSPSYTTVKNAIDQGKLVYVDIPGHSMVIYGYVGDADNYAFYYAFSNNNGRLSNSLYTDAKIKEYLIPEVTYGDVEMSDVRVHMDSDGDGITDFEEVNRFGTDLLLVDTDNDGIEDKREIYNYVMSGGSDKTHITYNPYEKDDPIYEKFDIFYNKADKNKNHILAELDPDDDGDGIEDGLKGTNGVVSMDVPENYTIFGREYVRVNDGVKCYNTQMVSDSYCDIAASDENKFSYDISYEPINIGARAHVGNVDVRYDNDSFVDGVGEPRYPGKHSYPFLRGSSVVHGNVNVYAVKRAYSKISKFIGENNDLEEAAAMYLQSQNPLDYLTKQDGASVDGNVALQYLGIWNKEFTYAYSVPMPSISKSQNKVVRRGETYRLKDGDAFYSLRVESGATLVIEPGEMFVDSMLQIEPNSTVRFAEPGKSTVLHTNGKINWRTYNSEPASNTQYWVNVARGFKLAHHSSQKVCIEGLWAGTVYAPKAKVVMGQVSKAIYGRILGRDVDIHQYSRVYRVDFNPTDATQVAYAF